MASSSSPLPPNTSEKIPAGRLFAKGYWERPALEQRKAGEPTPDLIFHAVGRALTSWEQSQDNLCSMVLGLCEVTNHTSAQVISRLFGSIENPRGRIEAVKLIAESYFENFWKEKEVHQPISALLKEIELGAMRRNDIAHGQVVSMDTHIQNADGQTSIISSGYMLVAASGMSARNYLYFQSNPADPTQDPFATYKSHYRFTYEDIHLFAQKFDSLNTKMFEIFTATKKNANGYPRVILQKMGIDPDKDIPNSSPS